MSHGIDMGFLVSILLSFSRTTVSLIFNVAAMQGQNYRGQGCWEEQSGGHCKCSG